jgi:pyruvate/2-oxoglutarate/acetoin dehydrogenase E1 component
VRLAIGVLRLTQALSLAGDVFVHPSAGAEVPMPYAANLEAAALPQVADIVAAVKKVMNKQ